MTGSYKWHKSLTWSQWMRASAPLLGVMLLCECGVGPGEVSLPPAPVATVEILPATTTLPVGAVNVLRAFMRDASGNDVERPVTWASSDPIVAPVSTDGVVTAAAEGTATITATSETKSATAAVTVWGLVFRSVSAGNMYSCGVTVTGLGACWGDETFGERGDSLLGAVAVPGLVLGGVPLASVSAGGGQASPLYGGPHSCGVTAAGTAYCWGSNYFGELGGGTTAGPAYCGVAYRLSVPCAVSPVAVEGGLSFAAVSAGYRHSCGLTAAGAAYCWGRNVEGALGDGTSTDHDTPAPVAGGVGFTAVSGGGDYSCGVTAAGGAYCWGLNANGQLGVGTSTGPETCNEDGRVIGVIGPVSCSTVPVAVLGGLSFATLSTGNHHSCGITAAGAAYCWGRNVDGALGDGTTTDRDAPTPVTGGLSFAAVSAGSDFSCGVTTAGAGYCWGLNNVGQLGDGTTTGPETCAEPGYTVSCSTAPVAVHGGLHFSAVSAGGLNTCGVTSAGIGYCWGAGVPTYLAPGHWEATGGDTPTRVGP
jgi:alpha-tubulin suppressor-like RCC1 family protein